MQTDEPLDTTAIQRHLQEYYGRKVNALQPVWRGYSDVYKAVLSDGRSLAVLLKRRNKQSEDLLAENALLSALAFRSTKAVSFPRLLAPLFSQTPPKLCDRYVSVFEWIDHHRFDGSDFARRSAFRAYVHLQRMLDTISPPAGLKRLALCRGVLDTKQFDFARFARALPSDHWAELYRDSIEHLQAGVQLMKEDYQLLKAHFHCIAPTIIHYDPTPQNVGFSPQGTAFFIMDFDQCKLGFWDYDVPWLVWSFASHGLNLADNGATPVLLKRVREYVNELQAAHLCGNKLIFRFCLLCRFCLTLHGRLEDTFERGFSNLRFMDTKILAMRLLIEHYDDFK